MPGNVILIGFSGSGKSSVSRRLAQHLDWPLIDTDQRIVEEFGTSIAQLFRDRGEQAFRAAEAAAVAAACSQLRHVVSVGGGAPVDVTNRQVMCDGNLVVRLDAPPEVLLARLRTSPNAEERPMLAGDDPLSRVRRLLADRAEAYAIADVAVDTLDRTPDEVAGDIARWVKAWLGAQEDER